MSQTNGRQQQKIPILITWDVDPDRWGTAEKRERALTMATDLCEAYNARSTFYITANHAHEYPNHIERMLRVGQEIGCHGLTHTDEEDYNRMSEEMQRRYIKEATQKLEDAVGKPIVSFRSPRVKTSATTLRVLAENGYRSDSSVCSQRVDLISSNLINPGWLVAPRQAYHPDPHNAFKRGNNPLWEIPVSAMIIPFISASLNVFGLRFMKGLFKLLYTESKRTGKPIVYLAHPTEFILGNTRKKRITLKEFTPNYIRTHGIILRKALYRMNSGQEWYETSHQLFAYMASFPDVEFMTGNEYIDYLENQQEKQKA